MDLFYALCKGHKIRISSVASGGHPYASSEFLSYAVCKAVMATGI
jgi:hypothetical protein